MSQSCDNNMANMHELFTVSSHTQSKQYHLPSCTSTVSTVRMQQHELWTYYLVDHTPRCRSITAAQTHHCNGDILALLERRIYHQNGPRLSLRSRLGGTWHAEQASWNTRRFAPFVQECISMATLVYAHGTAILTNREPSKLVAERIFYALQVRTRTII